MHKYPSTTINQDYYIYYTDVLPCYTCSMYDIITLSVLWGGRVDFHSLYDIDGILVLYCRPIGTEEVNLSPNFGQ